MIGKNLLHYRIVRELGLGGMGVAYEAEDTRLGRPVAIKLLRDPEADTESHRCRLLREARAAAALDHSNICTIYAVEEAEEATFLAMEYVPGRTLASMLEEEGPLDPDRLADVARQLGAALDSAHRRGVIHRDIKPANVMVTDAGEIKVLDFGVARVTREGAAREVTLPTLTGDRTGKEVVGTLPYMSPEQLQQEALDHRTDLFSLGVVLYELATGHHPFMGPTDTATIARILTHTPDPPSTEVAGFPRTLERVILRCLRKDRGKRYQDARALLDDLNRSGARRGRERIDTPSIGVLPFRNLANPGDEYFSDGLASELTSRLARVKELLVISHTATVRYRDSELDVRRIGDELGVNFIVEGAVRRRGVWCTINVELVTVDDGFHLWAESFEVPLGQIFDIQDRISSEIAEVLTLDTPAVTEQVPTADMQAFEAFLRAMHAYHKFTSADNLVAIELLQRALALDPGYAEAQALLANAYLARVERSWEEDVGSWLEKARHASERALELNPAISRAHSARAAVLFVQGDLTGAEARVHEALQHDSNNDIAHNLLGRIRFSRGEFEGAATAYSEALRINPYSVWCLNDLAWVKWVLGDEDGAHDVLDRVLAISPGDEGGNSGKAGLFLLQGRLGEALDHARRAAASNPRYPFVLMLMPPILARLGDVARAREVCDQVLGADPDNFVGYAGLGLVEAARGDEESLSQAASKAVELRPYFPVLSLCYAVLYDSAGHTDWGRRFVEKAIRDGVRPERTRCWHPAVRRLAEGIDVTLL